MVIRQREDLTQIGVLEDNVLVEHYVARESQTSLIGNVYLGRVQNVLPSMEAAFIDIGKGRNAVLYAGEVNWSALGHKDGQPRKIESVLSSGQTVLVQVTKDPIGHKGARLTSQVSLAGRFLVYVPDGTTSGISRKLPDTERNRLKTLLKEIVPEHAGVIVRTAAEGAARGRAHPRRRAPQVAVGGHREEGQGQQAPQLLYGEPDLTLKVVRDLFTEDFTKLVIEGDEAWDTVQGYVVHVAPDLEDRLERYEPKKDQDIFAAYRIDEQIKKGLERKVWLPSGGSLIIDRTEAMTVVDVNTGKFTGSGGNLEETVTKNNLEAAEEIVRQLRLRDIGGIIVVDFIDMVLESNRDLVLRRLVECLGPRPHPAPGRRGHLAGPGADDPEADRHRPARVVLARLPALPRPWRRRSRTPRSSRRRPRRSRGGARPQPRHAAGTRRPRDEPSAPKAPSPKDIAAMARHHDEQHDADEPTTTSAEDARDEDGATRTVRDRGPRRGSRRRGRPRPPPTTRRRPRGRPGGHDRGDRAGDRDRRRRRAGAGAGRRARRRARARAGAAGRAGEAARRDALAATVRQSPGRTTGASADGTSGGGAGRRGETPAEQAADGVPALHVPVKRKGGAEAVTDGEAFPFCPPPGPPVPLTLGACSSVERCALCPHHASEPVRADGVTRADQSKICDLRRRPRCTRSCALAAGSRRLPSATSSRSTRPTWPSATRSSCPS